MQGTPPTRHVWSPGRSRGRATWRVSIAVRWRNRTPTRASSPRTKPSGSSTLSPTFRPPVILILTGGDPLKRPDIFTVAARASQAGLRVVMSPSGTHVTPASVAELKRAGVQRISVSLDGSTPALHDSFRQVPGAFEQAIASLAYAREGGLPFQINTTVTRHNRHDLADMLRLAVDLGAATWDVFMLVPTGRGKVQMEITPEEYEETLQWVYGASQTRPHPGEDDLRPPLQADPGAGAPSAPAGTRPAPPAHGFSRGCMAGRRLLLRVAHRRGGRLRLPAAPGGQRPAGAPDGDLPGIGPLQEHPRRRPAAGALRHLRVPAALRGVSGAGPGGDGELPGRGAVLHVPARPARPAGAGQRRGFAVSGQAHEGRLEAVPNKDFIPPAF